MKDYIVRKASKLHDSISNDCVGHKKRMVTAWQVVAALVSGGSRMVTKKDRRHSGWMSPQATIPWRDVVENDLFIDDYYDDWENYRDGFRRWYTDHMRIRAVAFMDREDHKESHTLNLRLRRFIRIRRARKEMMKLC